MKKKPSSGPVPKSPVPSALWFYLLLFLSWACVAALFKWDAAWVPVSVVVFALVASWLGRRQPIVLRVLVLATLVFPIWKKLDPRFPSAGSSFASYRPKLMGDDAVISTLVTAEETCLALTPHMSVLSRGLMTLRLPGAGGEAVFAPSVQVLDLGPLPPMSSTDSQGIESRVWPLAAGFKVMSPVDLWRPLFDAVASFDHAKVIIATGQHPGGDPGRFEAEGRFDALAKMKTGEWRSLHAQLSLVLERTVSRSGQAESDWRITRWKTEKMDWIGGARKWFVETLDTALPRAEDLAKARHSAHYEATVKYYREGMKPPHPYFAPISVNQKEGIAIGDVNGDGFDDIYVTVRIGKNMFFRNRGNGTFTEEAAAFGLDLPGHTTCALLADFDNDGDLDAMLGRSLLKTTYLENRQGRFVQHPIPKFMPMAVISMSAADFNGDGLLDVYLCTYRPASPAGASPAGGVAQVKEGDFDWPDEFFSPELARDYRRRLAEHKQRKGVTVLDQLGPPNVLLVNRGGGRFEPASENSTVGIYRNSLQATWGDYNEDGKPDLYVANDWGVDVLFRNDGAAGFTDVTTEMGLTPYGFAMGASWGDYDNDGREDLYVSNMYSEAGRRMTGKIPGLDNMFMESAMGNWLYHRQPDGKFKQVAGMEPPAMTVMNAGWSWGGCFADFDNDSFLDLYVLSGYFTAPAELSSELDIESNLWRTMVRTDESLARPSFRFSPEWKRTHAPDNLGPQIDARLAGIEREGDKVLVHSLNGNERNHYFHNRGGRSFLDVSAISGLDNVADSRGFALLDYDRDGWQDVALVNANQPLFNLYRNEMSAAGRQGGMIAVRFVGGSRSSAPSKGLACRDGYGARISVDLGSQKLVREHRCGDGWSTQNSATLIVGVGQQTTVAALSVRWPSGKTAATQNISEGTLLTIYENPADSPTRTEFVRAPYRGAKP
ncbi:MAG: CRTAC1 family protein [Verrucomicrobiales bacterium]|nr:CRTAC1 family protein [Verrucomicrobiales bacterium]